MAPRPPALCALGEGMSWCPWPCLGVPPIPLPLPSTSRLWPSSQPLPSLPGPVGSAQTSLPACGPFLSDGLPQSCGSFFLFCGPHYLLLKILQRWDSPALGVRSILYLSNDQEASGGWPLSASLLSFPTTLLNSRGHKLLAFPQTVW